jgi:secreted trypsin-like serine protease
LSAIAQTVIKAYINMTICNKTNLSLTCLMAYAILSSYFVASAAREVDERELNSRIIGGTIANAKRYPYFTHLQIAKSSPTDVWTCEGSLVAPDIVLTAGQCVDGSIYSITAIVNYTQADKTGYEYSRNSFNYITHKYFDITTFNNDIAALILDAPIFEVTPVKLNTKSNVPSAGSTVTVFGHGRTSNEATPEYPYFLMEVSIPVIPIEDCNDANSWNGLVKNEFTICAGPTTGGKGVCKGDAGAPLIIRGNSANQDIQVGIGSFIAAAGCALPNVPTAFTRVSYYTQWIQSAICDNSNSKPAFCSAAPQPTKNPTMKPITVTSPPTRKPRYTPRPTPAPTRRIRTRPPTPQPTEESFSPITPVSLGV